MIRTNLKDDIRTPSKTLPYMIDGYGKCASRKLLAIQVLSFGISSAVSGFLFLSASQALYANLTGVKTQSLIFAHMNGHMPLLNFAVATLGIVFVIHITFLGISLARLFCSLNT